MMNSSFASRRLPRRLSFGLAIAIALVSFSQNFSWAEPTEQTAPVSIEVLLSEIENASRPNQALGLAQSDLSEKQVMKSFRKRMMLFHPDRTGEFDEQTRARAEEAMKKVKAAKEAVLEGKSKAWESTWVPQQKVIFESPGSTASEPMSTRSEERPAGTQGAKTANAQAGANSAGFSGSGASCEGAYAQFMNRATRGMEPELAEKTKNLVRAGAAAILAAPVIFTLKKLNSRMRNSSEISDEQRGASSASKNQDSYAKYLGLYSDDVISTCRNLTKGVPQVSSGKSLEYQCLELLKANVAIGATPWLNFCGVGHSGQFFEVSKCLEDLSTLSISNLTREMCSSFETRQKRIRCVQIRDHLDPRVDGFCKGYGEIDNIETCIRGTNLLLSQLSERDFNACKIYGEVKHRVGCLSFTHGQPDSYREFCDPHSFDISQACYSDLKAASPDAQISDTILKACGDFSYGSAKQCVSLLVGRTEDEIRRCANQSSPNRIRECLEARSPS